MTHFRIFSKFFCRLAFLGLCVWPFSYAWSDIDCHLYENGCAGVSAKAPNSNPSSLNRLSLNPSAVPTHRVLGVETIFYKGDVDFGLVKGLGRVGAALSPSTSEDTFFGPPALEVAEDLLNRKVNALKYKSQKITVATAFNIFDNRRLSLSRLSLNVGVMAKYNKLTKATNGGAGVSGILGPFTYGYSMYNDETQVDTSIIGGTTNPTSKYSVETYNVGLFLSSLILDYSVIKTVSVDTSTVNVSSASLVIYRFVITGGQRFDQSARPTYDLTTKKLVPHVDEAQNFASLQVRLTPDFMVGALYNYYLLREISGSLVYFF